MSELEDEFLDILDDLIRDVILDRDLASSRNHAAVRIVERLVDRGHLPEGDS